jgi:hypothetical protein
MKLKLSTIMICLALITGTLAACYPVTGDDGYRTMPLGTGTNAPVIIMTESPADTTRIPVETTASPDVTAPPPVTGEATTGNQPDVTAPPSSTNEETTAPAPDTPAFEFDVIEEKEEIGTVGNEKCIKLLRYPALKGLEDSALEAKINKLLAQIASIEYQNRLPNASELVSGGTYVDYKINETAITFLGGGILSVRSEGSINYKDDSKDSRFVYCNVIDIKAGKDIALKKVYSDFGSIMPLFSSGSFSQISGDSTLTSSVSLEQLIGQYKYYNQYGTYPESYFTKDKLVIVIETTAEDGFFAEFAIDLSAVNAYLATSPTK